MVDAMNEYCVVNSSSFKEKLDESQQLLQEIGNAVEDTGPRSLPVDIEEDDVAMPTSEDENDATLLVEKEPVAKIEDKDDIVMPTAEDENEADKTMASAWQMVRQVHEHPRAKKKHQ